MYSVSKEFPLDSYQIITPSDNASQFVKGSLVRFTIPSSVGFFDSHMSKLQVLCRTSGANYKMCFNSQYGGVASMIDMIRVSQGGRVISEITEYSTLQHMVKSYSDSLSVRQRDSLYKGTVDYTADSVITTQFQSDHAVLGQGLNRSGAVSATDMEQDVKFQLELDLVALFEVMEIVPVAIMGDILLEIRLRQQDAEIMKVLPCTKNTIVCNTTTAATTTVLPAESFKGWTNLADSPLIKGQSITFASGTGPIVITALAQLANGDIQITHATLAGADVGKTSFTITKGADGNAAVAPAQFILSKAELQLQVVKPPQDYIQQLTSEMEGGQLMYDMDNYTTYRETVLAGIRQQTLTIPTTQSRAKAIFSVLRSQAVPAFTVGNSTDFDENGNWSDLLDYRWQIDGIFYPNQPIDTSIFAGDLHFPQEHAQELKKAFDAAGVGMGSMLHLKQNFVLGRGLSKYGSSMNLTATPVNLYLQYRTASGPQKLNRSNTLVDPAPFDVVSFCHHITRVAVSPEGLMVMN
jgi:hypothetical protein